LFHGLGNTEKFIDCATIGAYLSTAKSGSEENAEASGEDDGENETALKIVH